MRRELGLDGGFEAKVGRREYGFEDACLDARGAWCWSYVTIAQYN